MKKFALITGFLILCIASAFVCGCMSTPVIQPATPTPTATPITTTIATPTMTTFSTPAPIVKVYNESVNGTTVSMPLNSRFSVILLENPTTGYSWNGTVTNGLLITKATFTPPQSGLDGAGGSHTWDVLTIKTGQQKFSGIYKQPWMNATKNDTLFTLGVNVT